MDNESGHTVIVRTAREKADEEIRKQIAEIDAGFARIERDMVRPIVAHIRGSQNQDDINKLERLDEAARALRAERAEKEQYLRLPF